MDVTDGGDSKRRDVGSDPGEADPLLEAIAHAPSVTLPSPAARASDNPEKLAHFSILGRLGQGGMGIVYTAKDEKLGRVVALKVLPPEFEADETRRKRFFREARAIAAVTHPNIVTVYEIGEEQGRIFIAMELVEGRPLRALLQEGPLSPSTVLHLMTQAAAALAAAHGVGLVHRDLKPENILVTPAQLVKVLDFGLAKLAEGEGLLRTGTGEGVLLGTPAYMAPEQVHGRKVTAATDVFALGILLYELLTSRRPFTGKSLPQIVRSIERDTPPAPSAVNPLVPAAFDPIVARCLAKEPAERYPDAQALLADLQKLHAASSRLSLESTVERGAADSLVTPPPSTVPRSKRAWRFGAMLLGGVVGVALATALAFGLRRTGANTAAAPAPSAAPPSRARAMTDWPSPKTSSPEAAVAYATAIQGFRDGSQGVSYRELTRAVALDSGFAAAHLRLGLLITLGGSLGIEKARRHLAAARQWRANLDERDNRILVFAEAFLASPSVDQRIVAARDLTRDLPDDAEALLRAAMAVNGFGDEEEEGRWLDRAIDLDPKFAAVEHAKAMIAAEVRGDTEGTLAAVERCLAISPNAASCLRRRADVHSERGQCDQMERDARRLISVEPQNPSNYGYLWAALAAQGASPEALRTIASKQEEVAEDLDGYRRRASWDNAARLAAHLGDFATAETNLRALDRDLEGAVDESMHVATSQLIALYEEEGDAVKAAAVGDEFLRKMMAWNHNGPTEYNHWPHGGPGSRGRIAALEAVRSGHRVSVAQARAMREDWMKEWRQFQRGPTANDTWPWFFAWPARTRDDAKEALEALPAFLPLPPDVLHHTWGRGQLGRVYALAGDADRAIPPLRLATAVCGDPPTSGDIPGIAVEIETLRLRLLLGQMLEQKADTAGACEQYAAILERWGNAKPRSVTADQARARSKAIGCR